MPHKPLSPEERRRIQAEKRDRARRKANRQDNAILGGFIFIWLIGIALFLGFWGTILWAVVKLVNHYT